jgi:hypothetical protein
MSSRGTVLVLHLAGQYPLAGVAWQAVHHVVGLTQLGYNVYYIEDSGAPPYDPRVQSVVKDCSYNVTFVQRMMERFGLGDRWAYWDLARNGQITCYGLSRERLLRLYGEADALLNLCGATHLREEHLRCPVRVYVETDPVIKQVELAQGSHQTRAVLAAHTHHFTYGENLGKPDCPIPLGQFDWKFTRPPVMLDLWEYRCAPQAQRFTTVATWQNDNKGITFGGEKYYWSKHANFLRFQDLPRRTCQKFELALGTVGAETAALLREKGWFVVDPYQKSRDLDVYQDYIYGSRGEFTVAKDLVVRTRSGWFSDRSVCFLAAGKPVVTQETGFSKYIPTGRGLFAFSTMEDILAALDVINRDYLAHARAAREIAQEYFNATKVLAAMLRDVGIA